MVTYRFTFGSGESVEFHIDLARTFDARADAADAPAWTRLEFRQCSHCPLSTGQCRHCPVAVDLAPVVQRFKDVISHTQARIEVIAPERTYTKECDVQTGLRSLLGLVMATSACPIMTPFKGQAASHLPFATLDETVVRTVGAYLLRQYFVHRSGGTPDLDLRGLQRSYDEVRELNRCFSDRLAAASEQDANMNALYSLLCVAEGVSSSLDEKLQELRVVFVPSQPPQRG